ncbi:MAG: NAD-dependent epimerase/dehydratase family protein, partial [Desulfohalobiaceae bacterium]
MNILVTGCSGFIGRHLVPYLSKDKEHFVRIMPGRTDSIPFAGIEHAETVPCRCISTKTNWKDVLQGVDAVVHLAARAHVRQESAADSLTEFRKVNAAGSVNLAQEAARAGANRFIFISSIGVYGNQGSGPITVHDPPAPVEPYAVSKLEAEMGLRKISAETGLEVVIIRPPLVYGPGAPGNFARLLRLVQKGVPLPLGLVQNKRSLVAVDNLVDLILTCVEHPAAAGETFL